MDFENDTLEQSAFYGNLSLEPLCNASCNGTLETGNGAASSTLVILEYIAYVLQPLILVLGLTGNAFNVIIMSPRRFSHVTSRYFLVALSITDSTTLLTQIFNREFVISILGFDARSLSDVGCKIFWFVFRTTKIASSWFVVFICIDRFIAVKFPLKAKLVSTKRLALMEILLVSVVTGSLNAYWSYASKIVDGRCHPDAFDKTDPRDVELFRGLLTAGSSLCFLVPMLIMGILSPFIVHELYKQRKNRKRLSTMGSQKKKNRDARISAMLIGITIAFFVLVTPGVLLHNIAFYLGVNAFGQNMTGFLIYKETAQILEQINYAINFFLYILTSSQFRSAFWRLVSCQERVFQRNASPKSSKTKSISVFSVVSARSKTAVEHESNETFGN